MILLNLGFKWRFDNKGIGSDQNQLKRKIKEALKSTEGRDIIESLTNLPGTGAQNVRGLFYNTAGFSTTKMETWVDQNFNAIFNY